MRNSFNWLLIGLACFDNVYLLGSILESFRKDFGMVWYDMTYYLELCRRRFFYYVFHIQWQKYLFENVDFFWHLMWKTFCHFYRANSTKTNLWTCNLWIKWSVSYKSLNLFWFNHFCHWMWKMFFYSDRANSNL